MMPKIMPCFRRDPWFPRTLRQRHTPHHHLWLNRKGSLTARLRSATHHFQVKILFQGRRKAFPDEARLLTAHSRARVWTREVLLCDGDHPLVFAHSVLPYNSLRGPWRKFTTLGNRPMGEKLFSTPSIHRGPLHFRKLPPIHPLRRSTQPYSSSVAPWARRSLFLDRTGPLLVTEIFLHLP
ncbi:MAG: chorismate lyase [Ferrovum sp.]|nr:chorismate lyase [Ferrovum sp.]NDU87679.1 chorismate lyase [Ferrovum sp.]